MANYCTTADVLKELALRPIDTDTDPSTSDVDQYCTDITADMNSRMRSVAIDTPVVDVDLLEVLKPIAVSGVAAKVFRAKNVKGGDLEWAETYQDLYDAAMERIEQRPSIVRETDSPGQPQAVERKDADIKVTRTGAEW